MDEYQHYVSCFEKNVINAKKTLRSTQAASERVQQLTRISEFID